MNEIRARVISQEKGLYKISSGSAVKNAAVSGKFMYTAATVSDYPAVGDYVIAEWPEDGSNAVIHSVFPRKSCFIRKAAGPEKQEQVVAANIDTVFLCMSLNNDYNIRRIERYLAVAYDSGTAPVIVLTKADLCDDVESKISEIQGIAFGVDVVAVSSLNMDFDVLMKYILPDKTIAFLGSSGVGKSTLINKLIVKENALGFDAIRNMAEKTEGSFCYTILDDKNNLYIVKGDNPMAIYKFSGFYLYASTDEILTRAVKKIGLKNYSKINISCGDILRITPNGTIEIQTFNFKDRYFGAWGSYYGFSSIDPYEAEDLFIDEITEYAGYFGIDPDDVMMLLEYGYDELEIEEMLYDPLEMQKCISEIKLCEMMC